MICTVCGKEFTNKTDPNAKVCRSCKYRQTMKERYGVDNAFKSPEIQSRIRATLQEKYGVQYPIQNKDIKQKMMDTVEEKYGVPYFVMTEEYQSHVFSTNQKFSDYLTSLGIDHEREFRIGTKSYDFKLSDTNILIEVDPTPSHNSLVNIYSPKEDVKPGLHSKYHIEKTELAIAHGFRCIHIFDWDDVDKLIRTIIPPKYIIYARKCEIKEVESKEVDEFLSKYHLQGTVKGQIVRLGLFHEGKLVQILTFGKPRYNKNYTWELLRLCTDPEYKVIGGASKLYQYARKECHIDNVISYCDRSKFSGDVYLKLGMKLLRNSVPQEIWSKENKHISANLLRQRGFDQLFNADYGKGTSNEELMIQHGWLPVFDCGQGVYVSNELGEISLSQIETPDEYEKYLKIKPATKGVWKACEYCGKEFFAKNKTYKYCNGPHYMICPVCGKEYLCVNKEKLSHPPVACSYECRQKRAKQTTFEKCGVYTAPGNTPEARAKAKAHFLEKFGSTCYLNSEQFSSNRDTHKGQRQIYNPISDKQSFANEEELESYLSQGWILGTRQGYNNKNNE